MTNSGEAFPTEVRTLLRTFTDRAVLVIVRASSGDQSVFGN
jgi:hypothetical protein